MKVIGLTGGIASGKTTIAGYLKELGAIVIDADKVGHSIMEKGKPSWKKIKDYFGEKVLNSDGSINRKKLASIVFKNQDELEKLNSFTHDYIVEEIKEIVDSIIETQDEKTVVVIDAALLIETGLYKMVDEVWLVVVEREVQLERLIDRDPITSDEALDRIEAQMPTEEKKKYADRIIDNGDNIEETLTQVKKYWEELQRS